MDGNHPRARVEGIKDGCEHALNTLSKLKIPIGDERKLMDCVERSAYMTKVTAEAIKIIT